MNKLDLSSSVIDYNWRCHLTQESVNHFCFFPSAFVSPGSAFFSFPVITSVMQVNIGARFSRIMVSSVHSVARIINIPGKI